MPFRRSAFEAGDSKTGYGVSKGVFLKLLELNSLGIRT
jgi:hypothetical protein